MSIPVDTGWSRTCAESHICGVFKDVEEVRGNLQGLLVMTNNALNTPLITPLGSYCLALYKSMLCDLLHWYPDASGKILFQSIQEDPFSEHPGLHELYQRTLHVVLLGS